MSRERERYSYWIYNEYHVFGVVGVSVATFGVLELVEGTGFSLSGI